MALASVTSPQEKKATLYRGVDDGDDGGGGGNDDFCGDGDCGVDDKVMTARTTQTFSVYMPMAAHYS